MAFKLRWILWHLLFTGNLLLALEVVQEGNFTIFVYDFDKREVSIYYGFMFLSMFLFISIYVFFQKITKDLVLAR